jgi:hypothetical protein
VVRRPVDDRCIQACRLSHIYERRERAP